VAHDHEVPAHSGVSTITGSPTQRAEGRAIAGRLAQRRLVAPGHAAGAEGRDTVFLDEEGDH
jgi:hypothetical protein